MYDPAAILHMAYGLLRGNENAGYVDCEHCLIVIEGDFVDRTGKGNTGIVHQNVEAAELIDRRGNGSAYRVRISGIRGNSQRARARFFYGDSNFLSLRR
jgi:hypothetical protein